MLKHRLWLAALLVAAAAAFLGVHGSLPASGSQPSGLISVDVSPGGNSASSVGPIGASASVSETCGDNNPGITVELVISGIPGGKDIGGWQARIQFDPNVLNFIGFQVSDSATGAAFYMEKASDHTPFLNNHITVSSPTVLPVVGLGTVDIGSTVLGTPAGANGVGLLARLFFDCVGDGVTSIDIGDGTNSFYADAFPDPGQAIGASHEYAGRNGAILAVNVGEEALAGRTPTVATPGADADASSPATTTPSPPSAAPSPGAGGAEDIPGSPSEPGTQPSTPEESEASPAGFARGAAEAGGSDGDDWIIPVIASVGAIAGVALIAGAAIYWRRFRRRT